MKVSVFGFGYVGATLAGCLAQEGITVLGYDIDVKKNALIQKGVSPFKEKEVSALLLEGVRKQRIKVTESLGEVLHETDISFICVGTPSREDGSINLDAISNLAEQLNLELRNKSGYHLFVIRSTVPPGTTQNFIKVIEKNSGLYLGKSFGGCMNPEFLREGTSVQDFYHPPFTIIGQADGKSGDLLEQFYDKIGVKENIHRVKLEEAEIFKYTNNAFHGLKVGFANEIGRICNELGIDSHKIMNIFCQDKTLNLSPYYLKPGFAFGGSCLPKDLKGILTLTSGTFPLVLESVMKSNDEQIRYSLQKITEGNPQNILISGITFKNGTDDFRESPYVKLMRNLKDLNYNVQFVDNLFEQDLLLGANKTFIESTLPQMGLLAVKEPDLNKFDTIIIGSVDYLGIDKLKWYEGKIIDLNGLLKKKGSEFKNYKLLV
ncbi:nucleotide sugar dehydrogenase [Candidatus Woesearchaeota archaeon]|nr:nucleotide sugar dehydrogenase [Candidatus Woesearchaeota archaeon]